MNLDELKALCEKATPGPQKQMDGPVCAECDSMVDVRGDGSDWDDDPIPGIAKKLYGVWCAKEAVYAVWDELSEARQNAWIQVASAACIEALGSDHLTNALAETRAEVKRLREAAEQLACAAPHP